MYMCFNLQGENDMEPKEPLDNQGEMLVDKSDLIDEQINSFNESKEPLEEL